MVTGGTGTQGGRSPWRIVLPISSTWRFSEHSVTITHDRPRNTKIVELRRLEPLTLTPPVWSTKDYDLRKPERPRISSAVDCRSAPFGDVQLPAMLQFRSSAFTVRTVDAYDRGHITRMLLMFH